MGRKKKPFVRWMIRRDHAELQAVDYLLAAPEGTVCRCWTEEELVALPRRTNAIGMVAEIGEKVVGFMIYRLEKKRIVLEFMAVHPDWQRQGVGAALVGKLMVKLSTHRRNRVRVDVPVEDVGTQVFFGKMGWGCVGEDGGTMRFVYRASQTVQVDSPVNEEVNE